MKNIITKIKASGILLGMLLIVTSCSKSVQVQGTRLVPAAEAKVKLNQDKNSNYEVSIDIENLAQPQKLTPSQSTYVAWYQNMDGTRKLGQIRVNNNLKGSLETVVTSKPQKIFVTAEPNASVNYPGSQVVLETDGL